MTTQIKELNTVDFWRGDFGNAYIARQNVKWQDRAPLLKHIIEQTGATTFIDVGTNVGHNLLALRSLSNEFAMSGIDVNEEAVAIAGTQGFDVHYGTADQVAEMFGDGVADMVITSGVLIHIAPEDLKAAMQAIVDASSQYVLAIEYESPQERAIEYRGHDSKLWARPFGKLYQDLGMSLVETGVATGYDQCTYWLLEKN